MSNLARVDLSQNSTGLALRTPEDAMKVASIAAQERLYGVRNAQEAFVRIATGLEIGLSPFQSLNAIHVIEGRPTLSAQWMVALIKSSPICEKFVCTVSTDKVATYVTKRKNEGEMTLSFTIEQAQRGGLTGRGPWKAHTEDMLRARAASKLARMVYPDLLAGMYTPDEVADIPTTHFEPAAESAPRLVEAVENEVVAEAATEPTVDEALEVLKAQLSGAKDAQHLSTIADGIKDKALALNVKGKIALLCHWLKLSKECFKHSTFKNVLGTLTNEEADVVRAAFKGSPNKVAA